MKNQRHLLFLSLVTLFLAMPQALRATDYFEDKYTSMCFMVTPNGQGCVHIKVLHLDQCTGNNGYIERNDDRPEGGWVYVMAAGESKRRYLVVDCLEKYMKLMKIMVKISKVLNPKILIFLEV